LILDAAIHDINQMLRIAQSPAESVYATGHSHKAIYRKAGDPDQILRRVAKYENEL